MFNLKIVLVAAAVAGHILPLFADFRGGKGVATLAGAVLAVYLLNVSKTPAEAGAFPRT